MSYYNQSLTLKHVTAISDTNKPTATSSTIKGRLELGYNLVRDQTGEEIVSTAWVITETPVEVNDYINDKLVVAGGPEIGLDGSVHHWEVYLK